MRRAIGDGERRAAARRVLDDDRHCDLRRVERRERDEQRVIAQVLGELAGLAHLLVDADA